MNTKEGVDAESHLAARKHCFGSAVDSSTCFTSLILLAHITPSPEILSLRVFKGKIANPMRILMHIHKYLTNWVTFASIYLRYVRYNSISAVEALRMLISRVHFARVSFY